MKSRQRRLKEKTAECKGIPVHPSRPDSAAPPPMPTLVSANMLHSGTAETIAPEGAPKARQRNSKRREYMGQNPNKRSTTYRDLVERMRREGKIKTEGGIEKVQASDHTWIPLEEAELSHKLDAMKWWNETGKYWGRKHGKVREFMTEPENYILDEPGPNRSAGAKLKETGYDPPDPRPDGPPQPPPSVPPPDSR